MRSKRTAAAAAAALGLVLAACGGSSAGSSSTTGAASGGSTTIAATGGATGKAVDVCAQLPATEVATITGLKVTAGSLDTPGAGVASCNYTGGLDQLDVDVTTGRASDAYQFEYDANTQVLKATAVTGIGDKAYTTNFPSMWLAVLWGNDYFSVNGASTVTVDQAKQLVTELHSKIG